MMSYIEKCHQFFGPKDFGLFEEVKVEEEEVQEMEDPRQHFKQRRRQILEKIRIRR